LKRRITSEISINGVRAFLAENDKNDTKLLDFVDQLLGALLVLSPAVLGPIGLPLLALIEPKNQLVDNIQYTIDKFASRSNAANFTERTIRLAAVNCLITFTAYFDVLAEQLPELMGAVNLTNDEKLHLASAATNAVTQTSPATLNEKGDTVEHKNLANLSIAVPHPADSPEETSKARLDLYERLASSTCHFITGLKVWDDMNETHRESITDFLNKNVPGLALKAYQSQQLTLAMDFPDYFVWSMFQQLQQLQTSTTNGPALIAKAANCIDVGLSNLAAAINGTHLATVPSADREATKVSEALHRCYEMQITQPVIQDSMSSSASGQSELNYPRKIDAFVPQGYKAIRYKGAQSHIGLEPMPLTVN
jgi:hypothetical protein